MASNRGGGRCLRNPRDLGQSLGNFRGCGRRDGVVAALERCARFLHVPLGIGDRTAQGRQRAGRRPRTLERPHLHLRGNERGGGGGNRAIRVDAGGGLAVGGELGGVLGPLAAVERVVQRQPVVTLLDGFVGVLQRLLRRGELLVRVLIGAGRARRVDRALRLLHFFLRWIAAAGGRAQKEGDDQRQRARAVHPPKYTSKCRRARADSPFAVRCSTMKELSPDDRPREKLLRHGAAALGDNELVALILGSGF